MKARSWTAVLPRPTIRSIKAARIGEILLFSSILALLIALAPATIAKLHS